MVGLVILGIGAGCTGGTAGITTGRRLADIVAATALERFEGCDELLDHLHDEAAAAVGPWGLQYGGGSMGVGGRGLTDGADDMALSGAAVASSEARAAAPAPVAQGDGDSGGGTDGAGFSGTNVQEAGIDEPDIVKTDGRRLLTVAAGRLRLIDLTGELPRQAGTLELPDDLWDHRLFLIGDRALVMGQAAAPPAPADAVESGIAPRPGTGVTTVMVVDVADIDAPSVVATVHLEGGFVAARVVDDVARVVLQSWPEDAVRPMVAPQDDSFGSYERAAAANADAVRETTVADWLPAYSVHQQGALGPVVNRGQLVACDQVHHPVAFSGVSSVSVVSVDPADPTPRQAVSVLGAGETVYASAANLYVTTTAWPDAPSPRGPAVDIAPARAGDVRTDIHVFDIRDPVIAQYRASGAVPGRLLNQFSMSEHDGHLRVATTEGELWVEPGSEDESSSTVTVLVERDGALVPVGRLEGLGRSERIYAVRFMGDLGYVVTFRQTDPLYVIDLSEPTAPRVRGELKILGYSAYLHPVGDGLLLGVGQDATEEGRRLGTQVSLFDVTDPTAPARLHQLGLGASETEAEYDHHAFLWWPATGTLVIPLQSWGDVAPGNQGTGMFSGAVALQADADAGIREIGRLSHLGRPGGPPASTDVPDDWAAQIRRSVVVGDLLLTLSEKGVLASDLTSLDDRVWLAH